MTAPKKIDFLFAAILGFATAIFALPSLMNVGAFKAYLVFGLPFFIPLLWLIGLAFARLIYKWLPFGYQFAKFIIVGFSNTALDFGVLNLLSLLTSVTSGFIVGGVNIPGFVLAASNSYFWNKFWVFRREKNDLSSEASAKEDYSDFFTFLTVAVAGLFLNAGIVISITTFIHPILGLSPAQWLNMAKVVSTVASLVFNFLGFKFFVFKK